MNEPFHSIAAATIFVVFAMLFGLAAISAEPVALGDITLQSRSLWMVSGVSFVMSYFSLVHLKHR